jgi:hypothetical protein
MGYDADPLSADRIALFLRYPTAPWSGSDLVGIVLLILVMAGCFVVPYAWVLPIHYASQRWARPRELALPTFPWTLRHAWLGTSAYLLCVVIALVSVGGVNAYLDDVAPPDQVARLVLTSGILLGIGTFVVAGRAWIRLTVRGSEGLGTRLFIAGSAFFLFVIVAIAVRALWGAQWDFTSGAIVDPRIVALIDTYGWTLTFFLICLFVPVYEEVLFRGVLLSALDKRMPFWLANLLQAGAFGAMHFDASKFVQLAALALVIGWVTRRTQSLLPAMLMHAANNMLALMGTAIVRWVGAVG